jgi:hypothetical protein
MNYRAVIQLTGVVASFSFAMAAFTEFQNQEYIITSYHLWKKKITLNSQQQQQQQQKQR